MITLIVAMKEANQTDGQLSYQMFHQKNFRQAGCVLMHLRSVSLETSTTIMKRGRVIVDCH